MTESNPRSPLSPEHTAEVKMSQGCVSAKRKRSGSHKRPLLPEQVKRSVPSLYPASRNPPQTTLSSPELSPEGIMTPNILPTTSASSIAQPGTTDVPMTDAVPIKSYSAMSDDEKRHVQQIIDQQIGLEILLKHRELRLIDQEIAKCQIALEQLRRCTEIPYPMTQNSQDVSLGMGAAVAARRPGLRPLPDSPAPWGVTDGPYTRHYAQWLLPDSRFDGGEASTISMPSGLATRGRSSRGSFEDHKTGSGGGRTTQASKGAALRAMQPISHPKSGPTLLKRKSDGAMVKLKCVDCGRSDFGSPQGFINHCRIQHQRSYSSHDAAAEEAGEKVELDEAGAIVGEEPASASANHLIHPLVRSARTIQPVAIPKIEQHLDVNGSLAPTSQAFGSVPTISSPSFNPSSTTPHLSDLVRFRGLGLDLHNIVTDAKSRPIVAESEPESENDETEVNTPVRFPSHGRRPPTKGVKHATQAQESSGYFPNLAKGAIYSPTNDRLAQPDSIEHYEPDFPHGFAGMAPPRSPIRGGPEPSPTESHQAPSLVDDDGDADEAHSPPTSLISPDESMSVDFHVADEDVHQDESHRFGFPGMQREYQKQPADVMGGFGSGPSRQHPPPLSSGFRSGVRPREEKHVTFISPSPGPEPDRNPIARSEDALEAPKKSRSKRRRTTKG